MLAANIYESEEIDQSLATVAQSAPYTAECPLVPSVWERHVKGKDGVVVVILDPQLGH